jgi:hypothetical protein
MLQLKLQVVPVIQIMGNSTQVRNRLAHPVISLDQKIQMEPDMKKGATKVTHNPMVPRSPRTQVERDRR